MDPFRSAGESGQLLQVYQTLTSCLECQNTEHIMNRQKETPTHRTTDVAKSKYDGDMGHLKWLQMLPSAILGKLTPSGPSSS